MKKDGDHHHRWAPRVYRGASIMSSEVHNIEISGGMFQTQDEEWFDVRNETKMLGVMAGSDCPGVGELGAIMKAKAHKYYHFKTEEILNK